jgi:hypothetical protein
MSQVSIRHSSEFAIHQNYLLFLQLTSRKNESETPDNYQAKGY